MSPEVDILKIALSDLKEFYESSNLRRGGHAVDWIYLEIVDVLVEIERSYAPSKEKLEIIKKYLVKHKDKQGLFDKAVTAIEEYLKAL